MQYEFHLEHLCNHQNMARIDGPERCALIWVYQEEVTAAEQRAYEGLLVHQGLHERLYIANWLPSQSLIGFN
jgi:hypothetical protein